MQNNKLQEDNTVPQNEKDETKDEKDETKDEKNHPTNEIPQNTTNLPTLVLNENQHEAVRYINNFIEHPTNMFYLLLGAAGSGKSTVLSNIFQNNKYRIIYCAFTNKATQVLEKISEKYGTNIECLTIHKLLALKPTYKFQVLEYEYVIEKIEYLKNYDIIVFDECSTISKFLYEKIIQTVYHILEKYDKVLKCIMTGDFWQLPPVNEKSSIVFTKAVEEKWNCIKLTKVMRAKTEKIFSINTNILDLINKFKINPSSFDIVDYPFNMLKYGENYLPSYDALCMKYINLWKTKTSDLVILSYSNKDCEKINFNVQNMLNEHNDRPYIHDFYVGDRCCIKNINDVYTFKVYNFEDEQKNDNNNMSYERMKYFMKNSNEPKLKQNNNHSNILPSSEETVYSFNEIVGTIYNGEIFDIVETGEIKIYTKINKYLKLIDETHEGYFKCQLLSIQRIDKPDTIYKIINIRESVITEKLKIIKARYGRYLYHELLEYSRLNIPVLSRGYCITIYKSQGSEFDTVLININNIKNVITTYEKDITQMKRALIKTTYTAITRATSDIYLL